jgi:hypothetical protein
VNQSLQEKKMYRCVICRFTVEFDDSVAPTPTGGCVCVRCFARETDSSLPMPKELRRDVIAVLAETAVA